MVATKKPKSFGRLTKAQKRVAIAKDVIAQLLARKIKATSGVYCRLVPKRDDSFDSFKKANQASELISSAVKKCEACAVGSMMIAGVSMFSAATINELSLHSSYAVDAYALGDGFKAKAYMRRFFSGSQVEAIGNAFEGWTKDEVGKSNYPQYRHRHPSHRARLIVLMKNIVRNHGTFIPDPSGKK